MRKYFAIFSSFPGVDVKRKNLRAPPCRRGRAFWKSVPPQGAQRTQRETAKDCTTENTESTENAERNGKGPHHREHREHREKRLCFFSSVFWQWRRP
jgi:hypothetical protein